MKRQRNLSIPSRIIIKWKRSHEIDRQDNFQFHQGLSNYTPPQVGKIRLTFLSIPSRIILIVHVKKYKIVLLYFQFHQGLSTQSRKLLFYPPIELSIPSRIINWWGMSELQKKERAFNSIKDYQDFTRCKKKDLLRLDFQFHQGLSIAIISVVIKYRNSLFQFHQGLSLIPLTHL